MTPLGPALWGALQAQPSVALPPAADSSLPSVDSSVAVSLELFGPSFLVFWFSALISFN